MMIVIVIIVQIAILLYRVFIAAPLYNTNVFSWIPPALSSVLSPSIISSATGSVLQLLCILILEKLYNYLAGIITELEMHRTQTEFERHWIFKVFIFQFLNYNVPLFYAAFFQGNFVG